MKSIDPKLKEAVDVLKFIDHRVRQELKNREKSNGENAGSPQSAFEGEQSPPLGIQQQPRA